VTAATFAPRVLHEEAHMPRPVHFEFVAADPERAERFWMGVFGWRIEKWDGPHPYWLVTTGEEEPGIDGGIMSAADGFQAGQTILTVSVDSVEETTASVEREGGTVVAPRMPVPGVGWLAYCQAPGGATFGVLEADETAGAG
jgi:predicted enzyme related to lactoylglutathione lyase